MTLCQANLSEMSLQEFIMAAREKLQSVCRVSVLADFLVVRFNADVVLNKWMNEVKMPHSALLHGKSVVDETHVSFTGTYLGAASIPQVKR